LYDIDQEYKYWWCRGNLLWSCHNAVVWYWLPCSFKYGVVCESWYFFSANIHTMCRLQYCMWNN